MEKRHGYCRCGCGQKVSGVYSRTRKERWQSEGEPKEYLTGHSIHPGHGMSYSPEYQSYCDAKTRCTNPKDANYKNYGGRGVKFLFTSFEQFFAEVGFKPEPKRAYSIDRIDNDGNYELGNVCWATRLEQAFNRRLRNDNSSGHTGVYWSKRDNNWEVEIGANGKRVHLGSFKSFDEACKVRTNAEIKLKKEIYGAGDSRRIK